MPWDTNGLLSSSPSGTVLADTGALNALAYTFTAWLYSEQGTGYYVELQHRNAANTATLNSQILYLKSGEVGQQFPFTLTMGLNERLRLTLTSSMTDTVQGSLIR